MARLDELLRQASTTIGGDSPRLDAEVLLCHVLGKPRSFIFTWPDYELETAQLQHFQQLIEKRRAGHPVAHLTGEREFWSLPLSVNEHTLIPRPDTEKLVELALERLPADRPLRIADLGTGSGAIALALASERPRCSVLAVDQSIEALTVARHNAEKLGLVNIQFREGNWLEDYVGEAFDLIASNPPYIAEADPHLSQGDVRFEPLTALTAGADGLDDIRIIADQAMRHLKPGGWLLLEHGYDQAAQVQDILRHSGFVQLSSHDDYNGQPRVTLGCKE